jgi:hypothetical protein
MKTPMIAAFFSATSTFIAGSLVFAAFLGISPSQGFAQEAKKEKTKAPTVKVDTLKRDDYITTACGCAYYAPTSKREDGPMYLWINGKGEATMKLDGQMRSLKVIKEERVFVNSKPQQGKIGSGDKVLMVLKADTLSASITNTAERNCTIGPDCSQFRWQSTINLSEFEGRKSMNAWAVCGCPGRKLFKAEEKKQEE